MSYRFAAIRQQPGFDEVVKILAIREIQKCETFEREIG
jgi:hypothetical protein